MAILYVFTVNDPNNAGAFPPSVTASSWGTNTNAWFQNFSTGEQANGTKTSGFRVRAVRRVAV